MRGRLTVSTSILLLFVTSNVPAYWVDSENGFVGYPIEELTRILNDDSQTTAWSNVAFAMGKSEAKREAEDALLKFIERPEPILNSNKPYRVLYRAGQDVMGGKIASVISIGRLNNPRGIEYLRKMLDRDFATQAISAWSQNHYIDYQAVPIIMGAAARGLVCSRDPANEKLVRETYATLREQLRKDQSEEVRRDIKRSETEKFFVELVNVMVDADVIRDYGWGNGTPMERIEWGIRKLESEYAVDLALIDPYYERLISEPVPTEP